MILQNGRFGKHCEKCYKQYTNVKVKWCRLCQSSGNEHIDDFIQEKQSKTYYNNDVVFEWISYDQFDNIKEIGKDRLASIYLAIWKDGTLDYNYGNYTRDQNKKVTLKYSHNSQNRINEFLNKVRDFFINLMDSRFPVKSCRIKLI